jgi:hypothetical protein
MPVGDAGDAILRHSALGQRQPHDPKWAGEDSGSSHGDCLSNLISVSHAGRSSRTVLTNFNIETGFVRSRSCFSSARSLAGRTAATLQGGAAFPHCPHNLQVFLRSVDACDHNLRREKRQAISIDTWSVTAIALINGT